MEDCEMKRLLIVTGALLLVTTLVFAGGRRETTGDQVELRVWGWTIDRSDGISIHDIADSYMARNPNVTIELMGTNWNEAYNSLLLMSTTGNMPDIVQVNRNWLQDFVKMGILEDLSARVAASGFNDRFYEPLLGEDQGKTWILPYLGGNSALVINRGLFNELGLEVPTTFEEFVEIGKRVSDPNNNFYATQFCMSEANVVGANVCNFGPILTSFGGQYVRDRKAAFNAPEGVRAMQWMIDMEKTQGIATPGSTTIDARRMRESMAAENVLMTFDGAWGTPFYANYPELEIEYVLMPRDMNVGTVINIANWGIARDSKHKDVAWDFLQYVYSDENLAILNQAGNMPITPKLGNLETNRETYSGFLETLAESDNFFRTGSVPNETELYRLIVRAYHQAMLGRMSVQAALDEAAAEYNALLKEFYGS
jgi:ABC-type glycerol-3-phosphate transport system substrate-binding protein